jgi:hypothetical protein
VNTQDDVGDAVEGAVDVAEVGLTTTSAVSTLPLLSVIVSRTVPRPQDGAVTVVVVLLGFAIVRLWVPTFVHE